VSAKPSGLERARGLSRDAYRIFSDRGARLLSGSIAFYALLSVVPILVIALRVTGLFVDSVEIENIVQSELERWVGVSGARTVLTLVAQVRHKGETGSMSLVGAVVLIYGATRLFSQLTRALDLLWDTPPPPEPRHLGERIVRQLEKRVLSFLMVLLVGILLLATFFLHAGLASARHLLVDSAPLSRGVEALVSLVATALLFSLIFRVLPRAKVTWLDALLGGAVTALLFTVGSLAITAYVTRRDMTVYGAASAIVMLMLWVHYSAHAFFFGASFTVAHFRQRQALSMVAGQ
jgi:membrane protein